MGNDTETAIGVGRMPTGITGFDEIANGGLPRNGITVVLGSAGSGKTTLGVQVLAAGARRYGEPGILVAFEESPGLLSYLGSDSAIRREAYRLRDWMYQSGLTALVTAKADDGGQSLQPYFDFLQFMADCVVTLHHRVVHGTALRFVRIAKYRGAPHSSNEFPLAINQAGLEVATEALVFRTHSVSTQRISTGVPRLDAMLSGGYFVGTSVLQMLDVAKSAGITVVFTSLLGAGKSVGEQTPLNISTIADTWIHVSYINQGGERNRSLSIVKSRGSSHSNQLQELMLSNEGITLADVFAAGGEVLMGTLRWEKENEERRKRASATNDAMLREQRVALALAETKANIATLAQAQVIQEEELLQIKAQNEAQLDSLARDDRQLLNLRSADPKPKSDRSSSGLGRGDNERS